MAASRARSRFGNKGAGVFDTNRGLPSGGLRRYSGAVETELEPARVSDDAAGRRAGSLRQHNLATVLSIIHEEGQIPRSALTTRTGLNRSTISALVKELTELGFVTEAPGTSGGGAGRPSLTVQPTEHVIAFSALVEIDAISVAAVALSGRVVRYERRALPDAPAARTAVVRIAELIERIRGQLPIGTVEAGLGVAVPGQVQDADGVVTESLPLHWANVNLAAELSSRLRIPVFVDNDARLSLRGAQLRGTARAESNIVYLHGRASGISGAIVADGELLRGRSGLAGAVGLIRVHSDRLGSLHEHPGTLDALVRREVLLEALGTPDASDDELGQLLTVPLRGRAERVVREQSSWLASGLATIVNLFNPDTIVLDGFLVQLFDARRDAILHQCATESVARSFETVRFVCERTNQPNEILGAAELPLQSVIADPLAVTRLGRPRLRAVEASDDAFDEAV